ncbi:MAG: hypothetical protein OSA97_11650, partial [Nevskia sp.]|nr:hypothetical protein [Nevskia sp.]
PRQPAPGRQRGAAAVFGAVALLAGVIAMLLSINIGILYFAQRDLQRLAVLGAMAGVQTASGCLNGGGASDTTSVTTRVKTALSSNLPTGSDPAKLLNAIGGVPAVQLGMVTTGKPGATTNDGLRHFSSLSDHDVRINAVVVNLTEPQPAILGASLFNATPGTLYASATAMQQPLAGFKIGSTLVSLNGGLLNALLSALLGSSISLSAVDYNNLASTQISLAGLELAAGVNDLSSLLSLTTNVAGLQQILVTATNTVNPSVANLLQGLTLGNAVANQNVPLASLLGGVGNGLNPTVTDAASLVPSLDLLDLLTQIGQAAAGQSSNHFLQLQITPSIPGLLNTFIFLSVEEPMQQGFGPVGTTAQTAQIRLQLRLNVDTSLVNGIFSLLQTLSVGLLSFTVQPINLGVDVYVAKAVGTLDSLYCPAEASNSTAGSGMPSAQVGVNANVATVKVGTFSGSAQSNPGITFGNLLSINGTLLGIPTVGLTVAINNPLPQPLLVGNTNGAQAGPFTIYQIPSGPISTTAPHSYNYLACNNLVALNPCTSSSDPNNPYAPIPSTNLLAGISTYIGQLVNQNELTITPTVLGVSIPVGALLDPLLSAINSLLLAPLTNLLDLLLNPLLQLLGLQVGSATVLMSNVVTGPPVLVNTALPGTANF